MQAETSHTLVSDCLQHIQIFAQRSKNRYPSLFIPNLQSDEKKRGFWWTIRNVLDLSWWFHIYPVIFNRFKLDQVPFTELEILPFISPTHVSGKKPYNTSLYFKNREYTLRCFRRLQNVLFENKIPGSVNFRIGSEGVWLPGTQDDFKTWKQEVGENRNHKICCFHKFIFNKTKIEVGSQTQQESDRKKIIQTITDVISSTTSYYLKDAIFKLPDALCIEDTGTVIKNRAYVESYCGSDHILSVQSNRSSKKTSQHHGLDKKKSFGSQVVTYHYDLAHLKEFMNRQIQVMKFKHLNSIGRMLIHEMNNPIGGIYNLAQMMEMSLNSQQKEVANYLKEIETQCKRAKEIIQHLSPYFDSDVSKSHDKHETLMIKDLFQQVSKLTKSVLGQNFLQINVDPHSLSIKSSRLKLLHVLVNLVINAAEALKSTHKNGTITMRARSIENEILLEVEDDGPGISPELLKNIFKPFFTTKPSNNQIVGIGLAMVDFFIKELNYNLEIDTKLQQGALFRIRIGSSCQTQGSS